MTADEIGVSPFIGQMSIVIFRGDGENVCVKKLDV
jgi:hypothetical protein